MNKRLKKIINISFIKDERTESLKEDDQIGKDTCITLDIKADPSWSEFEREIKTIKGAKKGE